MSGSEFIHIGRVARPHGLKGALKISGPWGLEGVFQPDDPLWLVPPDEAPPPRIAASALVQREGARRVTLRHETRMGGFLLFQTDQVRSCDDAERLRNWEVYGPADALARRQDALPHPHDALGMTIVTPDGRVLGEVVEVSGTPAQDLYVVRDASGLEVLLPAVEAFIRSVDLSGRRLVYDPPEGLLDINRD